MLLKPIKIGLVVTSVALLAGCEQYFRYPCQDPENWNAEECKKPICEVNRDCPEYIFKGGELEKELKQEPTAMVPSKALKTEVSPTIETKGECK